MHFFRHHMAEAPVKDDRASARRSCSGETPRRRVSWSQDPDEIDVELASPSSHTPTDPIDRDTFALPARQRQQHQQHVSTPFQGTPAQYIARQAMIDQVSPTSSSPHHSQGVLQPFPEATHMQHAASVSSAVSGQSSGGSGSLPPASFFSTTLQDSSPGSVFGEEYVANVKEVFYIRERPTVPQDVDGVIKSPAVGGGLHDAFKIDLAGRVATLKDLPSKAPILTIKKRTMVNVYNIFAGGSTNLTHLTAIVKRNSSTKLLVLLEKQAHIKYEAEGDFSDFTFKISRLGERVAQVLRDEDARGAVTSRHAFAVHVLGGTDCALMVAIALVAEEMFKEH